MGDEGGRVPETAEAIEGREAQRDDDREVSEQWGLG